MMNPCEACAEIICMGICDNQIKKIMKSNKAADNRRGERGQERTDPIL
mgnify:FL=1